MLRADVSPYVLKGYSDYFTLFYISTTWSPDCYKISLVSPINKTWDKSNINNYRSRISACKNYEIMIVHLLMTVCLGD